MVSGHAESAYGPVVDSLAPGAMTLVVLMGLRTRGDVAARLIARGWSPATPAAIVLGAAHEGASRWIGTLATLASVELQGELPGVLVIGKVVELAEQIAAEVSATSSRSRASH